MVLMVAAVLLWCAGSIPISLCVGRMIRSREPELFGMDGGDLLYRHAGGRIERVSLLHHAAART